MTNKQIIVIDVKKWGRFNYHDKSTGRLCVIGFCRQQNIGHNNNKDMLIYINDKMSGKARRDALVAEFAKGGVKVKFKNLVNTNKSKRV